MERGASRPTHDALLSPPPVHHPHSIVIPPPAILIIRSRLLSVVQPVVCTLSLLLADLNERCSFKARLAQKRKAPSVGSVCVHADKCSGPLALFVSLVGERHHCLPNIQGHTR